MSDIQEYKSKPVEIQIMEEAERQRQFEYDARELDHRSQERIAKIQADKECTLESEKTRRNMDNHDLYLGILAAVAIFAVILVIAISASWNVQQDRVKEQNEMKACVQSGHSWTRASGCKV